MHILPVCLDLLEDGTTLYLCVSVRVLLHFVDAHPETHKHSYDDAPYRYANQTAELQGLCKLSPLLSLILKK